MALCAPPYMPGYPGSILHGRAMCILICLAYMLSSCLYPCCLLAGMVYATSAIPVTFAIAVMYAVPETAAIPMHIYPFWNILGWHGIFYKCMPITMPDAPDIYANFMLFLLFLLCIPSKQAAIYSPDIGGCYRQHSPLYPSGQYAAWAP